MSAPCRKPKLGEAEEVKCFAETLQPLALELPRCYREKALAHFKRGNINIQNPTESEEEEIRKWLSNLKSIYHRKSEQIRTNAERKRVAAWELSRTTAAATAALDEALAQFSTEELWESLGLE